MNESAPQDHIEQPESSLSPEQAIVPVPESLPTPEEAERERQMEELKKAIAETPRLVHEESTAETGGTTFVAPERKQASFWKKAAVFGGMTLGLFGSKDATAQQKISGDKEGIRKEAMKTPEAVQELSDKEKQDWDAYVEHVKALNLTNDPRMNSRAFAGKILNDYVAAHPGTTLNETQVVRIQQEFAKLREWILKKAKNKEKINGGYVEIVGITSDDQFMPNLSATDGIAGHQTLRPFPKEYDQMIHETVVHLNNVAGHDMHADLVSSKKDSTTVQYLSMNE